MPKTDDTDVSNPVADADRIRSAVETDNTEDEDDTSTDDAKDDADSEEEDSDKNDDASAEEDSEDSSDDEDEDDEDKSDKEESERKFKNLAANDDAGYISNLEKAYENSSAEAIRLNKELGQTSRRVDAIIAAAQKDPDLAKRLNKVLDTSGVVDSSGEESSNDEGVSPLSDPFLIDAKTTWENKSRDEVQAILDANPELVTDPVKNANVKHWMEVFSAEEMKRNKRLMGGGEAMEAAMRHLGIEDKRTKQTTAAKAKELAAPTRAKGAKKAKSSGKKPLSDSAYNFAAKMNVSKESVEKYAQK